MPPQSMSLGLLPAPSRIDHSGVNGAVASCLQFISLSSNDHLVADRQVSFPAADDTEKTAAPAHSKLTSSILY